MRVNMPPLERKAFFHPSKHFATLEITGSQNQAYKGSPQGSMPKYLIGQLPTSQPKAAAKLWR